MGYGDAGQNFELKVQEVSEGAGAKRGVHHPCVFSMVARGLHYLHHGDDFAIVGTRSEVKSISEQIGQHLHCKGSWDTWAATLGQESDDDSSQSFEMGSPQ